MYQNLNKKCFSVLKNAGKWLNETTDTPHTDSSTHLFIFIDTTSIINLCSPETLFLAIFKNPIKKSQRPFVEETGVMLITRLAYKNMSSLRRSIRL